MHTLPDSANRLIDELSRLPGVGRKTAQRLAFHFLSSDAELSHSLSTALLNIKQKIKNCSSCHGITEEDPCKICIDEKRNSSFNIINKDVPSLFKIPVKLPQNSPAGNYFISMSLMDGGDKFETRKIKLEVKKPGISSFIFSFAHKFSFIYGIFSAIIAIALGVFASLVFRKL